jgi:hypothetical protein
VLEIQIKHPTLAIGAFYEDVLLPEVAAPGESTAQ